MVQIAAAWRQGVVNIKIFRRNTAWVIIFALHVAYAAESGQYLLVLVEELEAAVKHDVEGAGMAALYAGA